MRPGNLGHWPTTTQSCHMRGSAVKPKNRCREGCRWGRTGQGARAGSHQADLDARERPDGSDHSAALCGDDPLPGKRQRVPRRRNEGDDPHGSGAAGTDEGVGLIALFDEVGQPVDRLFHRNGGDVYDPAPVLLFHEWDNMPAETNCAQQIELHGGLPGLHVMSLENAAGGPPALVTRMWIVPHFSITRRTIRATSSSLVTSATMGRVSLPVLVWICAAACSNGSSFRAQSATRAPSRARPSAAALPSPLLDAQTSATLVFNPKSMSSPRISLS